MRLVPFLVLLAASVEAQHPATSPNRAVRIAWAAVRARPRVGKELLAQHSTYRIEPSKDPRLVVIRFFPIRSTLDGIRVRVTVRRKDLKIVKTQFEPVG